MVVAALDAPFSLQVLLGLNCWVVYCVKLSGSHAIRFDRIASFGLDIAFSQCIKPSCKPPLS